MCVKNVCAGFTVRGAFYGTEIKMQTEVKRKTLLCPGCGERLLRVTECIDLTVECFRCGASVSATVLKNGGMAIDFKPSVDGAFYITAKK